MTGTCFSPECARAPSFTIPCMNLLRFSMLLSLVVWLGALAFFPIVAQTAFTNVPTHMAGLVVRGSLLKLHWMAFACAIVYLATSIVYDRIALGRTRVLRASHALIVLMFTLTAFSQFQIIPRMDALRAAAGEISRLTPSDPLRLQFDSLHAWSTRAEGAILLLGLVVLYLTSRRIADRV